MWKSLWKSKLHSRHKLLWWRASVGALPVRAEISQRIGRGEEICPLCGGRKGNYYSHLSMLQVLEANLVDVSLELMI